VLLTKLAGGVVRVTWPPATPGYRNDIIRGNLKSLAVTHGDFTVATERCLWEDAAATAYDDPEIPGGGGGYWYLVREDVDWSCPAWGSGTYNSSYMWQPRGQVGDRDTQIVTSGHDCTCSDFCCPTYGTCNP